MSVCSICTNNGLAILAAFFSSVEDATIADSSIKVLYNRTLDSIVSNSKENYKRLGRVVSKEGIADLLKSLNNIKALGLDKRSLIIGLTLCSAFSHQVF